MVRKLRKLVVKVPIEMDLSICKAIESNPQFKNRQDFTRFAINSTLYKPSRKRFK